MVPIKDTTKEKTVVPMKDIGIKFKDACHLAARPLYVCASETIPAGSVPITSIDRCLAKAMFKVATSPTLPPVYLDASQAAKGCPGGMQWTGFCDANPMIKYFVSTGHKDFRNGMAEYLRATPDIAETTARGAGKFAVPGKYISMIPSGMLPEDPGKVLAVTCFGTAEQIRNLASLVHFSSIDVFQNVVMATGPACSTMVSYPAGLADKAPKHAAFIGPADPTGNAWFPPDSMALGIPISLAMQMASDIDASFLVKRPQVAFPEHRLKL